MRKGRQVGVERGGSPENLSISHPTQTLIALRTVGGNAQKVSPLAPKNIAPEPVYHCTCRLELNRERRIGVEDNSLDRIIPRRARISGDFDVTKTVKGKMRFEHFISLTPQGVSIGGFSGAQIVRIELSIRLENFSKPQLHLSSRAA